MADIALFANPLGAGAGPSYDLAIASGDVARDGGLETAVIISLFSDRQASANDEIPDGSGDLRGWWGDLPLDADATPDLIGSRLWLLTRAKATEANRRLAQLYCQEALQWLLDGGIAQAVTVTTAWRGIDRLDIRVVITRQVAGQAAANDNFAYLWNAVTGTALAA